MARMYFGFYAPGWNDEVFVPVDYIAFEKKKKNGEVIHVSVSCNGDSDFGADNNHLFSCRFKGLETCVEKFDKDGNEIKDVETHDYEEMSYADFKLLKGMHPYEIGLDQEDDLSVECPEIVHHLSINIDFYDADQDKSFTKEYYKERCDTITY